VTFGSRADPCEEIAVRLDAAVEGLGHRGFQGSADVLQEEEQVELVGGRRLELGHEVSVEVAGSGSGRGEEDRDDPIST
jgi:hypothetical protein